MRKRTLVVDVDDTISMTVNRDYANATPDEEMINKLNNLYLEGWEVIYFTARGQLSANKDIEVINKTRLPVLKKWMKDSGVLYTDLKFGKPFGDYYVDDKALRPDEFLDMSFDTLGGRSEAEVSRVGDLVMKVADNTRMQTEWYAYNDYVLCPEVVDSAPSVYRMEYIFGKPGYVGLESNTVQEMIRAIDSFKRVEPMPGYTGSWASYVDRCLRKFDGDIKDRIKTIAMRFADYCESNHSFCHGDMTLSNIIVTPQKDVFFIDPSVQKGVWSSWLIDFGRIMQSLRGRYEERYLDAEYDDTKKMYIPFLHEHFGVPEKVSLLMETLILCRIWHHQKRHDVEHGEETMNQILELLETMENVR